MKIELHRISIRDVVAGYEDSAEEGVIAYDGKLDIRPKYQREFVYTGKQRDAVIETIKKDFPLNVMYWVKTDGGNYEVLDGQQRTISIAQYVNGDFSLDDFFFHNLTDEEQNQILDYELMIYFCEGTPKEKLDWFGIINIAGEKLTDQELRNAVFTWTWLSDAKLKFSKTNCAAYLLANDGGSLLNGSPIRQEYLETALSWINNEQIKDYMAKHQHDENSDELWSYFQDVIAWVRKVFTHYRKDMKGIEWWLLYNSYKETEYDSVIMGLKIQELIHDDDVQSMKGIYVFLLTGQEKYLNLRQFDDKIKAQTYLKQKGICTWCKEHFEIEAMEADHITPWHEGGKTTAENCQMLCKNCNRTKSGK